MSKLTNDIEPAQVHRMFEILLQDSPALRSTCTTADLDDLLKVLKVCSFEKGDLICRKGEPVDMVAIVCYGSLKVCSSNATADEDLDQNNSDDNIDLGAVAAESH